MLESIAAVLTHKQHVEKTLNFLRYLSMGGCFTIPLDKFSFIPGGTTIFSGMDMSPPSPPYFALCCSHKKIKSHVLITENVGLKAGVKSQSFEAVKNREKEASTLPTSLVHGSSDKRILEEWNSTIFDAERKSGNIPEFDSRLVIFDQTFSKKLRCFVLRFSR